MTTLLTLTKIFVSFLPSKVLEVIPLSSGQLLTQRRIIQRILIPRSEVDSKTVGVMLVLPVLVQF